MVVENFKAWVRQNVWTKLEADARYYTRAAADVLWAAHAALTAVHGATGAVVGTTNTQTLTGKTLTAPIISTISNTGTLTLPTSTDTLVGRATTDTLTNKTLTSPAISDPTITGSTGAWTALTLNTAGNWANYGGGVVQDAEYKKVGDLVFLRGLVKRTSGSDTTIATLPSGYRPPRFLHIATASIGAYGQVNIDTDGSVFFSVGTPTDWVSLNNICFSVV